MGFLNAAVEQEALEGHANRMLDRLAGYPRAALAAQKRLLETWQNAGLRESMRASVREFTRVLEEEETRDKVRAYRERAQDFS